MPEEELRRQTCAMISRYATPSDLTGLTQLFTTLTPIALLWWVANRSFSVAPWLTFITLILMSLFIVRGFGLMHECGHGSLFRTRWLNSAVGFVLGVLSGMPQYVWAQHHNYHHAHNGNWDKYRGPYGTLSVDEYTALSRGQQRMYRTKCSVAAAPLAGLIYLILTPRFTWMRGSLGLLRHAIRAKCAAPKTSWRSHFASYPSRYWKTSREYRHMLWNNLVLLSVAALMCWTCGAARFFTIYLLTVSVAGGMGIVLFTVQHNFEHAYASDTQHWNSSVGAIQGTSYLVLPGWLNWFTVNIGYHHIHHLAASIPNYRLASCHREYEHLFGGVARVRLAQVLASLNCILWDRDARQIISLSEYRQRS